ncbi:MAG TPA: flagellar basal body rod protein FlgC [Stellaceae bacterium]|nr:flagellar basal body rod protein FlgC [Stellaceae bacterium]
MDFNTSLDIAFSGMTAESARLKVIAENLANADSTGKTAGSEPYRRQVVTFTDVFDRAINAKRVKVGGVVPAAGAFGKRYEPGHPAADADGYVLTPNVNPVTELMDMREAQRSYEANLNVIDAVKAMVSRTIDLLHG